MLGVDSDPLGRLPSRQEVGREIAATARRARKLRSLYQLLRKIETDAQSAADHEAEAPSLRQGSAK